MDFHVVIACILAKIYFTDCSDTQEVASLRIGVLVDFSTDAVDRSFEVLHLKIAIKWYPVDMTEAYQVLRAVNIMDRNDMDGIVIFHNNENLPIIQPIIATLRKPVFWWRSYRKKDLQNPDLSENPTNLGDICVVANTPEEQEIPSNGYGGTNYIDARENLETDTKFLTINTPGIIQSLVAILKWKLVIIIHETGTEQQVARTIDLLSEQGTMVVAFNVDLKSTLWNKLQEVYHSEIIKKGKSNVNFLVLCRFNCAKKVLEQANEREHSKIYRKTLLRHISLWIVIIPGFTPVMESMLKNCASDLDNVVVVAIPNTIERTAQHFELAVRFVLLEIQNLAHSFSCTNSTLASLVVSLLRKTAALMNPAVFCKGFHIKTLLWTTTGRGFSTVGYAMPTGYIKLASPIFPNIHYGFNKREFLISTIAWDPFVIRKDVNGTVAYEGFCFDLVRELSLSMNFTYRVVETPDGFYGATYDNGSWNGMVGQLERHEVDMVVADLTVNAKRAQVMDFTFPFYYDYTAYLIKRPDPDGKSWRKLIDPFHWHLLVAVCACLPLMAILTYAMDKHNPFYQKSAETTGAKEETKPLTFNVLFWYMFAVLCNEGGAKLPKSFTGRTMVSAWWIFCIIIIGIYTGNLIAFLTATNHELPFNTLDGLLKLKGEYFWGVMGKTILEVLFKSSSIPVVQAVWQGVVEFNRSDPDVLNPSVPEQVNKVKAGGYTFFASKVLIDIEVAKTGYCDMQRIDVDFFPQRYAVGLPKNSPLTNIVSAKVMDIESAGLLKIWKQHWWPSTNKCNNEAISEAKPTRLLDVQGSFLCIAAGTILALTVLGIENLLYCVRHK